MALKRSLPFLALTLALGGCGSAQSTQWDDPLGGHRSGQRWKITWAQAPHDPGVRWPVAIYDLVRARRCAIVSLDDETAWCLPVADETIDDHDIAFLDEARTQIARIVDDARCREAAPPADGRLYALAALGQTMALEGALPRERANRYELEAPRLVHGAFTPEGPGCVVSLKRCTKPLCVAPLRRASLDDLTTLESDPIGGAAAAAARAVRYRASDGAILPDLRYARQRAEPGEALPPDHIVDGPRARVGRTSARLAFRVSPQAPWPGLPLGLHDLALGRDCVPRELADGVWRCVVLVPSACTVDEIRTAGPRRSADEALPPRREVLTPSASYCADGAASCCAGGPVWLPGSPALGARRFGDAPAPHPTVAERAVLFAPSPHRANDLRQWQPQVEAWVWSSLADVDPDTFARLDLVVDP